MKAFTSPHVSGVPKGFWNGVDMVRRREPNLDTIGGRIQYARVTRGLTQEQLAKDIGVTKGAISQWETGIIKGLTGENLLKLADALEVNERWLIRGKEFPMGKPMHLDPDTSDLVQTYIQLPEHVRDELRSDAHKYLRITAPQQSTKSNPYPKQVVKKHK